MARRVPRSTASYRRLIYGTNDTSSDSSDNERFRVSVGCFGYVTFIQFLKYLGIIFYYKMYHILILKFKNCHKYIIVLKLFGSEDL